MMKNNTQEATNIVIRFCGDSGDGMQLTGTQFTDSSAIIGNDINTFPDFPAEIRAPAGTEAGVSGFQINFSSEIVNTPGDYLDALVAMNPASLKKNLPDLKNGGLLLVNSNSFSKINIEKAGYTSTPINDALKAKFSIHEIEMTTLVEKALKDIDLKSNLKRRCKNFFALGLTYWIYHRPLDYTINWIKNKFKGKENLIQANIKTLKAGYSYGITTELSHHRWTVASRKVKSGKYRQITGNTAISYGLITGAIKSNLNLVYATYPITPASDILHELSKHKNFNVKTIQAEDEIAAAGIALGASYAGSLGITASSGPGICLKAEFIGLAVAVELPLVICNIQRGGPSTGLPTKTEQSDLLLALYGRNGESPVPVIAPSSPGNCFDIALTAVKIAVEYMTPVLLLSDGYLANGSDLWKIPDTKKLTTITPQYAQNDREYKPYARDKKTLSRKWAIPGTKNLEHTLTGLEKSLDGTISYDPNNHEKMSKLREQKIQRIADSLPPITINGKNKGKILIIGWGGTYGAINSVVTQLQNEKYSISHIHLCYINPLPNDLKKIISNFDNIIVPELNLGQLIKLLKTRYKANFYNINKIQGQPFKVNELKNEILKILKILGI